MPKAEDEAGGDGGEYILRQRPPEGPLSGRNLKDFLECPRKYLLSHFTTHKDTEQFIGGPATLHRAVRTALLKMYADGGMAGFSEKQLAAVFEKRWDGKQCKDSREEEQLYRDGQKMLSAFFDEPIPWQKGMQVDVRLEGTIEQQEFVAVADLLGGEPPIAVRFITSRRPPSKNELTEDISWGLLWFCAAQRLQTDDIECVMVSLRKERTLRFCFDAEQRRKMRERVTDIADDIHRERNFEPESGKYCRWCRSRRDCEEWRR